MAAALTLTGIKQSFYDLVGSASILAALGASSASVILKQALRAPHPVAPFIAVAYGAMPGERQDVRTLYPTLWLYDDDIQGWARLNALTTIVEAIFVLDCIPYCETQYAGGISEEVTDEALHRPAIAMRYQVKGRF